MRHLVLISRPPKPATTLWEVRLIVEPIIAALSQLVYAFRSISYAKEEATEEETTE